MDGSRDCTAGTTAARQVAPCIATIHNFDLIGGRRMDDSVLFLSLYCILQLLLVFVKMLCCFVFSF